MTVSASTIRYAFPTNINEIRTDCYYGQTLDTTGAFVNISSALQNSTASDVSLPRLSGCQYYFSSEPGVEFSAIEILVGTVGVAGVLQWQYWNGSVWTNFTPIVNAGSLNFTGTSASTNRFSWNIATMTGWTDTTVNGISARWIRAIVTTTFTTGVIASTCSICRLTTYQKQIDIPITQGRIFTNVFLRNVFYGNNASAGSVTGPCIYASIDGGPNIFINHITAGSSNSGENYTYERLIDLTELFTTYYTGNSHLVNLKFGYLIGADTYLRNTYSDINCELFLNYTFDETTETNAIKTIEIPINSQNSILATTFTTLDTVPALNLPESNINIKQAYFIHEGNSYNPNSATSGALIFQVDSTPPISSNIYRNDGSSSVYLARNIDLSGYDYTIAHDFKARVNSVSFGNFNFNCGRLILTYTFTPSSTDTLWISRRKNLGILNSRLSSTVSFPSAFDNSFVITENNPTIKKSSLRFKCDQTVSTTQTSTLQLQAPGESVYTAYSSVNNRAGNSGQTVIHRAITANISSGENSLVAYAYNSVSTQVIDNVVPNLLLNYTCDIPSGKKWWQTNKQMYVLCNSISGSSSSFYSNNNFYIIPYLDSEYYIDSASLEYDFFGTAANTVSFSFYLNSNEGNGKGAIFVNGPITTNIGELGISRSSVPVRNIFSKWNGHDSDITDNTGNINPSTPRRLEISSVVSSICDVMCSYTSHSIIFPITGRLINYSGDGSGLNVRLHRYSDGVVLKTTTTTVGGYFSFNWYIPNTVIYVGAYQNDLLKGRSKTGIPGSGYDVILRPPEITSIF